VTAAFSVGEIVAGLSAPFVGRAIDRIGARRAIGWGAIGIAATFFVLARVEALWQYFAAFALQTFAATWALFLPFQWLLAQWFVRRRGLAIGIATAGFGLGGSVFLPLIALVIARWGWRAAYQTSGVIMLGFFVPLAILLVRNRPRDLGLQPDGDPEPPPDAVRPTGQGARGTLGGLIRTPRFWALAGAQALFFAPVASFGLHAVPFFESEGRTAAAGATIVAAAAITRTPLRVVAGWWLDRRLSLAWYGVGVCLLHAACLALLLVSTGGPAVALFVAAWGVGGALGPLLFSLTSARTFGSTSFAMVSGSLFAVETVVAVVLPPLGGYLYDQQRSYVAAFSIYAVSLVLAAGAWAAFGLLRPAVPRDAGVEPEPARA
ncbi:MAG: MFS transporter, partial [Dehalococcoidia bacterium]